VSKNQKTITRSFLSQTERLHEVREFVAGEAREFGFSDEEVANITLAVDEACTNIIKHTYQYARDKALEISVTRAVSSFTVSIVDEGRAFDPSTIPSPDLKQHLAHFRRGGLGVYLMKKLMDKVEYGFAPNRRNQVVLTKYRNGASASPRP
jgi:serine/threonine-protein kinase RsbW